MIDEAKAVRTGEEQDWKSLESYLNQKVEACQGKMQVAQFYGGHANLTYLLTFGDSEFVLRRPPFGKIAPGAHDMKREFRVLSKLYQYFPQAPRAYHYCEDLDIIGSPFVLVERRSGVVVRYKLPEVFASFADVEKRLTDAMIKAQATLHRIDVEQAELTKLGRPDGYLRRQLDGWSQRWDLSKIDENPNMTEIFEILTAEIPEAQAVAIVHSDIKFDNCQFAADNPDQVSSIFDWDMTTLGDPLADVGMTLSYWPEPLLQKYKSLPVSLVGNFPDKDYLKAQYAAHSGFDLAKIDWYESLSYWKGAVIAQQLYTRYVNGATKDERMKGFGESAKALAEVALIKAKSL